MAFKLSDIYLPSYDINYDNFTSISSKGELSRDSEKTIRELKVCSWNVNGIRSHILRPCTCVQLKLDTSTVKSFYPNVGLGRLIDEHSPDMFCLQETRSPVAYLNNIQVDGWDIYAAESQKGGNRSPNRYSGTAIFVNREKMGVPVNVITRLPGLSQEEDEGRIVALEFKVDKDSPNESKVESGLSSSDVSGEEKGGGLSSSDSLNLSDASGTMDGRTFWIVNCYTPNSGTNSKFRNEVWNKLIMKFLGGLDNVIYCGDMNVARTLHDITFKEYPDLSLEQIDADFTKKVVAGFRADERTWFEQLLREGFVDSWRRLNVNPEDNGYTYVDNLKKGGKMRIDYHLVKMSNPYEIKGCDIEEYHRKESDHIPLILTIRV